MSYMPRGGPGDEMRLERISEREHNAEIKADSYAQLHPDGDQPAEKRPGLLSRLLKSLRGQTSDE